MNKKALILVVLLLILLGVKIFLPHISFFKGKQCFEKGDFQCAVTNLKQAYSLSPSNLDYEYYYTKSLTKIKADYETQKEMFNLSKNAKSSSAKKLAAYTVKSWKYNILSSLGNNYIEQVPSDTNIIRWNRESFPLNVIIIKNTEVPDYYESAIRRGLAIWAKSVDFVDFNITNNKSNAQIIIELNNLPKNVCDAGICNYMLGYTNPNIFGHTLKRMNINLYAQTPSGKYYTDKEIFNTLAHEIGHALGIMGHSYSSDDLMYPQASESNNLFDSYKSDFHSLSGKDINTLTLLYKLEPTITDKPAAKNSVIYTPIILGDHNDIITKKLKEAQYYIKTAPQMASGYIDLAGAYMSVGKYDLASDALLKGLSYTKTDDEKYIIYYNLSLIYYRSKKYKEARTYISQAKQIRNTQEVTELEYLIVHKIESVY